MQSYGGRVAVVDIDCNLREKDDADWLFEGDAAKAYFFPSTKPMDC